jgi:hypothetical protein
MRESVLASISDVPTETSPLNAPPRGRRSSRLRRRSTRLAARSRSASGR